MESIDISQTQEILSVSRLNREVRFLLEGSFSLLWVEGEISNFAAPHSGHWYFSLKDASAQVRCAMFKPLNRRLGFTAKDGMHVIIKARVSLYEGRGDFQLIIEHMEEVGEGKLRQAFEALKKRLMTEGLFDEAHKKPLPTYPKKLGVITSATGAAIRDILSVLNRRYPSLPIVIYPTLVQGESAAPQIVKAIQTANQRAEVDVILLARGGGSLEDLWPFNEEIVARAIYQSELPIVSGVGHEIDFTIADFVADLRAPTPSAAAELMTPDRENILAFLASRSNQLQNEIKDKLGNIREKLSWTNTHLQQQHPKRRLHEKSQQLDFYEMRLQALQKATFSERLSQLQTLKARLLGKKPNIQIDTYKQHLDLLKQDLQNKIRRQMSQDQSQLNEAAAKLHSISPLASLQRGYAIASHQNKVLKSTADLRAGDQINLKLNEGSVLCDVVKILEEN